MSRPLTKVYCGVPAGKIYLFILLILISETESDEKSNILQWSPEQEVRGNVPEGTPILVTTERKIFLNLQRFPVVSPGQEVKISQGDTDCGGGGSGGDGGGDGGGWERSHSYIFHPKLNRYALKMINLDEPSQYSTSGQLYENRTSSPLKTSRNGKSKTLHYKGMLGPLVLPEAGGPPFLHQLRVVYGPGRGEPMTGPL